MSVKSNYFKLDKEQFNTYLERLKSSDNTLSIQNGKYFYSPSFDITNMILSLNKKIAEFDYLINSFTSFAKRQIIQSFLIEEIESTNKIESIISTRHDIFSIINNASISNDKRIISIANSYKELLFTKGCKINSLKDIRNTYDVILKNAIMNKELPDGKLFRKGVVFVSNGLKIIHSGSYPEEEIIKEMNEFIHLYNSNIDTITKMILCHFIFENTHPFYDGNGRVGRYIFSNGLFLETKSYFSFLISSSFEQEKKKYYKAFKEANDKYAFGCLNNYVEIIIDILITQINSTIARLNEYIKKISCITIPFKLSNSEKRIYKILKEATILSRFGLSNTELIEETNISKRTVITTLNKFKERKLLVETKIGKYKFYKFQK